MRGRKQKPSALKILQGTARACRLNENEPRPHGDLVEAPEHFTLEQRAIWDYAIANAPRGLLKRLDLSVLEVWAVACAAHREAVQKLARTGQVIKSPSGYPIVNPFMSNMNRQAQIMLKAAEQLGFSPASRPRVHVDAEAEKTNPFESFGAARRDRAPSARPKPDPSVH